MTARGAAIVEVIRSALDATDKLPADEANQIIAAIVADLRTRRPMAVAPLSLWEPTALERDPRDGGAR